jgi:hypothetical protein
MPKSEAREAKEKLIETWGAIMADLTQQMIEQCREAGMDPSWFYPRKVVEKGGTIRIHWSIRPSIEIAFKEMINGGSAELAAKKGAAFDVKQLENLITDDTIWETE